MIEYAHPPGRELSLAGIIAPCGPFEAAFAEVNRFVATRAGVGLFELIGKYLIFLSAFRALAGKRAQTLELLKSGAMLGC